MSEGMSFDLQIDKTFGHRLHIICDENPQNLLGLIPKNEYRLSLEYIRHNFSHPAMPNLDIYWLERKPIVEDEQ
jgi:hypothetical protein